jgi:serine/threonine protein kinase
MPRDDDQSLGGEQTFSGKVERDDSPQSLGDEGTYAGGPGVRDMQSLGDQSTFGDAGGDDEPFDDGMEVVDLSARYTTEGVLGKGGMGEVLLAMDTRLERKVAIKRMLGDGAKSRTAVSRFLTEAKSIAALNHPNIVQIYDYGRASDGPFLIMEYVAGGSLLDRCREGALPLEEAVELTCQLCDGLGKAHDANIIHRDIKPANVLLTNDGVPKLTDFGLAKDETADTGLSVAGAVLGTLDFMPPEQRKDAALTDSRSDLWSLAATLYQMVTGKSPKIIKFSHVPQSLQDVLEKALEDEKDDRYQTAREFLDALQAAQQGVDSETLEEGQCPSCGTKNPFDRKFCRECAVSLEAECLSCSVVMPLWEKVCDSCGTKQADLLDERRSQMASDQSEAESLLKSFDFDRATELATALRDEPDLRLQHLKGWAEKFLPQIEQGRQQQLEQIGGQLTEAAAHEQAHDYAAGLRVLEKVPEILRETQVSSHRETVAEVMARLADTLQEITRLKTLIKQRLASKKFDGLLNIVDTLRHIQPDRTDLENLRQKLIRRESRYLHKQTQLGTSHLVRAKALLQSCDFADAAKCLSECTPVTDEQLKQVRDLQDLCRRIEKQRHEAIAAMETSSSSRISLTNVSECRSAILAYQQSVKRHSLADDNTVQHCENALTTLDNRRDAAKREQKHIRNAVCVAMLVIVITLIAIAIK